MTAIPEAKQRVAALGLSDSVAFLGPVAGADLPALYAGAELFVFPSLYEGFGFPVLEAMACGTPVICSNVSSLPEVAGSAALQVDPRDTDALAAAMDQCWAMPRSVSRCAARDWPRLAASPGRAPRSKRSTPIVVS